MATNASPKPAPSAPPPKRQAVTPRDVETPPSEFSLIEIILLAILDVVLEVGDAFEVGVPITDIVTWGVTPVYMKLKHVSTKDLTWYFVFNLAELIPGLDYLPLRSAGIIAGGIRIAKRIKDIKAKLKALPLPQGRAIALPGKGAQALKFVGEKRVLKGTPKEGTGTVIKPQPQSGLRPIGPSAGQAAPSLAAEQLEEEALFQPGLPEVLPAPATGPVITETPAVTAAAPQAEAPQISVAPSLEKKVTLEDEVNAAQGVVSQEVRESVAPGRIAEEQESRRQELISGLQREGVNIAPEASWSEVKDAVDSLGSRGMALYETIGQPTWWPQELKPAAAPAPEVYIRELPVASAPPAVGRIERPAAETTEEAITQPPEATEEEKKKEKVLPDVMTDLSQAFFAGDQLLEKVEPFKKPGKPGEEEEEAPREKPKRAEGPAEEEKEEEVVPRKPAAGEDEEEPSGRRARKEKEEEPVTPEAKRPAVPAPGDVQAELNRELIGGEKLFKSDDLFGGFVVPESTAAQQEDEERQEPAKKEKPPAKPAEEAEEEEGESNVVDLAEFRRQARPARESPPTPKRAQEPQSSREESYEELGDLFSEFKAQDESKPTDIPLASPEAPKKPQKAQPKQGADAEDMVEVDDEGDGIDLRKAA